MQVNCKIFFKKKSVKRACFLWLKKMQSADVITVFSVQKTRNGYYIPRFSRIFHEKFMSNYLSFKKIL